MTEFNTVSKAVQRRMSVRAFEADSCPAAWCRG